MHSHMEDSHGRHRWYDLCIGLYPVIERSHSFLDFDYTFVNVQYENVAK